MLMGRKNNIKMNKLFISCLSIFALCSAGYSQTYIYDKNLKLPHQILFEQLSISRSEVYSASEIISEFMSNEIRATKLFYGKPILIKGRIAKIYKFETQNIIALQVGEDEISNNFLSVSIFKPNRDKELNFDKIENYSVGDWINIHSLGFAKSKLFSYEYLFFGDIYHTESLNAKKNFLIKVINLPTGAKLSHHADEFENATKFSEVVNGKSFCKITSIYGKAGLNIEIKDANGNILKKTKILAKINCHSIFDYNKL
jgi:hypothetical protein